MPGAPDALQSAGDGLGRLDLQNEIDGAHVDAELEGAGRDEAGQLAGLQKLLDVRALLARERAVVGAGDLLAGRLRPLLVGLPGCQLVQPQRDALRRAAVVDKHDRGGVLAHAAQQLGVDRGPDRPAGGLPSGDRLQRIGRGAPGAIVGAGFGHRLDGYLDAEIELGRCARVEDRDRAAGADKEAPDLIQRALGRAETDALQPGRGPIPVPITRRRARSARKRIQTL